MSNEKKIALLASLLLVAIGGAVFAASLLSSQDPEVEDDGESVVIKKEPTDVGFDEIDEADDVEVTEADEDVEESEDVEEVEEAELVRQLPGQWTRVVAGDNYSCGLQEDRSLWCWGENSHGQLGQGDYESRSEPAQVGDSLDWTELTAGTHHICGIREGGSLWCWGRNDEGGLGDGSTTNRTRPTRVEEEGWTAVDAGRVHTCALDEVGGAFCWGGNSRGQLGDRTSQNRTEPVRVFTSRQFRTIAAATYYTCGIDTTGVLWCWGGSDMGHPIAQRDFPGRVGDDMARWSDLIAGDFHTCAIRGATPGDPGRASCWGYDAGGRVGPGSEPFQEEQNSLPGVWRQISARGGHTCGLLADETAGATADGVASCWGQGVPEKLNLTSEWREIAVGSRHTCAIDSEQSLYCFDEYASGTKSPSEVEEPISEFFILSPEPALYWYRIDDHGDEVLLMDSLDLSGLAGEVSDQVLVTDTGVAILTEERFEQVEGEVPVDDELSMVTYSCNPRTGRCSTKIRRIYLASLRDITLERVNQLDISVLPGLPDEEDFPQYVLEEGSPDDRIRFNPAVAGQLRVDQCLATHYEDDCGYTRTTQILPEFNPDAPRHQAVLPRAPRFEESPHIPEDVELILQQRETENRFRNPKALFCLSADGQTHLTTENHPDTYAVRWLGEDPPLYVRSDFHEGYIGHAEFPVYRACKSTPLYRGKEQARGHGFRNLSPQVWIALDESGWHVYRGSRRIAELPEGSLILYL